MTESHHAFSPTVLDEVAEFVNSLGVAEQRELLRIRPGLGRLLEMGAKEHLRSADVQKNRDDLVVTILRRVLVRDATPAQAREAVLRRHHGAIIRSIEVYVGTVWDSVHEGFWEQMFGDPEEEQGYDVTLTAREANALLRLVETGLSHKGRRPSWLVDVIQKLHDAIHPIQ